MIESYVVGIDLGTTNAVIAYAGMAGTVQATDLQVLPVGQWVGEGVWQEKPLFPTYRYHILPHEKDLLTPLPFPYAPLMDDFPVIFGEYAVQLGALNRGQGVASAKSWLSQAAKVHQDPNDAFLPFGANQQAVQSVPLISPVLASASYLHYLQAWWNYRFPDFPLDEQLLVLTVPASFDEYARDLTLTAAELAGLGEVHLLEEPTAAAYAWQKDADEVSQAKAGVMFVLDVGGGTTDLSIIDFRNPKQAKRLAVGDHLMLGGDNLDAGIAQIGLEAMGDIKVSPAQWSQLMLAARDIKESVLSDNPPLSLNMSLLGRGKSLVAKQRQVKLQTEPLRQKLLDGFLPQLDYDVQSVEQAQSGLVQIGLQFESNPAITAHVLAFIKAQNQPINSVLLNGGFFQSSTLVQHIETQFQHWAAQAWQHQIVNIVRPESPQLAVAFGAALYAKARLENDTTQTLDARLTSKKEKSAVIIGGGAPRSLILLLANESNVVEPSTAKGLVVMAKSTEEMRPYSIETCFQLAINQTVEFRLFSTSAFIGAIGDIVEIQNTWLQLPPLQTAIDLELEAADVRLAELEAQGLSVQLCSEITAVGTLQLQFKSVVPDLLLPPTYLEFAGRSTSVGMRLHKDSLPSQWSSIIAAVRAAYGPRDVVNHDFEVELDDKKSIVQLKKQLDQILSSKQQWNITVCRCLADELLRWGKNRRRSIKHETTWLTLVGFCVRPGYGVVGDEHRIEHIKIIVQQGPGHHEHGVWFAWWTLIRRCAGGFDKATQLAVFANHEHKIKTTMEYLKTSGRQVGNRSKMSLKIKKDKKGKNTKNTLSNKEQELKVRAPDAMLPAIASLHYLRGETWFESLLFKIYKADALGVNTNICAWCCAQVVKPGIDNELKVELVESQVKLWLKEDWAVYPEFGLASSLAVQLKPVIASEAYAEVISEDLRQAVEQQLRAKSLPLPWLEAIRKGQSGQSLQEALSGERLPQGLRIHTKKNG